MEPRDPKSAHPFALDRLTDEEWEELTFLLAWGQDTRVERLRAPDGGLDTVLPRRGRPGTAERWQAKHYAERYIDWRHCQESLDRAVRFWKVRHVTFTFPRDLTRNERVTFGRKLEGRHRDVVVDYWSGSEVSARLMADEAGDRAARRFFGHHDPIEVIERAMRAGGQLSRGEHAVDREFAVDEFLQGADPHFHWVVHKGLKSDPPPPQRPGAILRLMFSKDDLRMYVDAVPHTATAAEHHGPQVTVITDDSPEGAQARRLMAELFRGGGRLELREGTRISLDRLPRPFHDFVSEPITGDVTVRALPTPEPWFARLSVSSTVGEGELDIDLSPVEPPAEWDSRWRGERGGLEITISARWSVNEGRGETAIAFRYPAAPAPTLDRARALGVLVALQGAGHIRLIDRMRLRQMLKQPIQARPLNLDLRELYRLTDALAEIERFSGTATPPVPDEISRAEIDRVQELAEMLRAGGKMYRLREARMTGGSAMVQQMRRSGSDVEVRERAFT